MGDNSDATAKAGFQNIDSLPLGNLLEIKQQGRMKARKGLVKKLLERGFGKKSNASNSK